MNILLIILSGLLIIYLGYRFYKTNNKLGTIVKKKEDEAKEVEDKKNRKH